MYLSFAALHICYDWNSSQDTWLLILFYCAQACRKCRLGKTKQRPMSHSAMLRSADITHYSTVRHTQSGRVLIHILLKHMQSKNNKNVHRYNLILTLTCMHFSITLINPENSFHILHKYAVSTFRVLYRHLFTHAWLHIHCSNQIW